MIEVKLSPNKTPVLFLAGGGSDRAIAACVRSLSSHSIPYYILLPDKPLFTPWHLSKYRDRVIKRRYNSPTHPEKFKQSLSRAVSKHSELVLFPTSDRTIKPLLEDPEWLKRNNIELPLPKKTIRQQVSNKSSFTELAEKYDLALPPEINSVPTEKDIPFVAKPKTNISEDGKQLRPYLILNNKNFDQFFSVASSDEYFYQEFISGESVYYCALYNEGKLVCDFSQVTLCQQPNGGSVIKAAPTHIPETITDKFSRLMADLEWTGPVMVEFRRSDGTHYTIEANPRFWGPLQLAVDNGIDLPLALYHVATDQLDRYDNNLYQGNPGSEGYIRYNGYLNGWWKKQILGGKFENIPSHPNIPYHDVWLRCDTAPVFIFEMLRSAMYPVATTINSPERVKSFVADKFGSYVPL